MLKNMNKAVILILAILSIFLVYWYAIRPAQIRHYCFGKVTTAMKKIDSATNQDVNTAYEFCLHDKGL